MLTGHVNARSEAVVPVKLLGPLGFEIVLAVVDTGFDGSLTLPAAVVASLGLVWESRDVALLADGSRREFAVYSVIVEWDGRLVRVSAAEAAGDVLVGTSLLTGYRLSAEFTPGGVVEVTPL